MSSWTPKPGNGLPSLEPCSACGKVGDKWMKRGWCAACYQRWDNNGRPESGPVRVYLPRTTGPGTCTACGAEDVTRKTASEWCLQCFSRWERAGKPPGGPPPPGKRGRRPTLPGRCPICGRTGKLRAQEGWCLLCHQRWYVAGSPEGGPWPPLERKPGKPGRKHADLDKLARLRLMWALARPGEYNPYECIAPGCHETGDPYRQRRCAMHEARLRRSGTYDTHQCAHCGSDFKRYGGHRMLCDRCRESWGYCGGASHEGSRIISRERMPKGYASGWCKACANRTEQEKRRAQGVPSREEWLKTRRDHSRRSIIVGLAVNAELGTLITRRTMADALGLDENSQRKQIHAAVLAARRNLPGYNRALVTIWGAGYRVMRAALQPRAHVTSFSQRSQ